MATSTLQDTTVWDRLSSYRPKDLQLFVYSHQERIAEMQEMIRIKETELNSLKATSKEEYNLKEKFLFLLRKEIKIKKEIVRKSLSREQRLVAGVLKNEKQMQLQMRKCDIQSASELLLELCAFCKNVYNLVKYIQHKRKKCWIQKNEEMAFLDHVASTVDEAIVEKDIRRYENTISKTKLKHEAAVQLNLFYQKIFEKYYQESLSLNRCLENLANEIHQHHQELKDLYALKREIDFTLKKSQQHLRKTENMVIRAMHRRNKTEMETRKKAREMKVERIFSARFERKTEDTDTVDELECTHEERKGYTGQILAYEEDLQAMKAVMNARDTNVVLEVLVKEGVVNDEMKELKEQRESVLKKLTEELETITPAREQLKYNEENKTARHAQMMKEMKKSLLERGKARLENIHSLNSRSDILVQVQSAVDSILTKLLSMQEQNIMDQFAEIRQYGTVFQKLDVCRQILLNIIQLVESSKTNEDLRSLMSCWLFGEMVDKKIKKLTPSGGLTVPVKEPRFFTDDDYYLSDEDSTLTREEMKKRNLKFYMNKVKTAGLRTSV